MRYQQKIAQLLSHTGLLRVLELLPSRPGVVVFCHHRIGNRGQCDYNRDLFSATAEQFDYQISCIKRRLPTLLPHELAELIDKKKRLTRLHAIITFDDGYLDNFNVAFPILKEHRIRAAFFLVTSFIGTSNLPWWDEIAYLVHHTSRSTLSIDSGPVITVDLRPGREQAIDLLVQAFKSEENRDSAAFMQQLRAEAQVASPERKRQFIDWDEAKEMAAAGMEIGAHTRKHPFLSRLTSREQQAELQGSKDLIEQAIGLPVTSFAYPNGTPKDFTAETQRIAHDIGFTAAFSFYGGINPSDGGERYNLLRRMPKVHPAEFRAELALMSCLGGWKSAPRAEKLGLQREIYPASSQSL